VKSGGGFTLNFAVGGSKEDAVPPKKITASLAAAIGTAGRRVKERSTTLRRKERSEKGPLLFRQRGCRTGGGRGTDVSYLLPYSRCKPHAAPGLMDAVEGVVHSSFVQDTGFFLERQRWVNQGQSLMRLTR